MTTRRRGSNPEDLAGSLAGIMNMARALPEMMELWRVMSDVLMVPDENAAAGAKRKRTTRGGSSLPMDPLSLTVRVNALMLSSNIRYWVKWQQIVTQRLPRIRRLVDEYQADGKRDPAIRHELLDELRRYLREMAELPADQHRRVREEITKIEEQIFENDQMAEARRMNEAKR
ncbi:MAG: hypothetical protein U1F52_14400 [Burkholderiales bacterium]